MQASLVHVLPRAAALSRWRPASLVGVRPAARRGCALEVGAFDPRWRAPCRERRRSGAGGLQASLARVLPRRAGTSYLPRPLCHDSPGTWPVVQRSTRAAHVHQGSYLTPSSLSLCTAQRERGAAATLTSSPLSGWPSTGSWLYPVPAAVPHIACMGAPDLFGTCRSSNSRQVAFPSRTVGHDYQK